MTLWLDFEKRRSYDGSEVADTSMQKDVEAIEKLQEQSIAYEQFIDVAKAVYKSRIGANYTPRVKTNNPDAVKNTATAKQVDELLAKHLLRKLHKCNTLVAIFHRSLLAIDLIEQTSNNTT